jgi:hypothetical protein
MKKEWWMPQLIYISLRKKGCDLGGIKLNCQFLKSPNGKKQFTTTDGRFVDNRDGTVTDTKNSLIFMNTLVVTELVKYDKAESYCENLTYANHSDWKLPSKEQFKDIASDKKILFFLRKRPHWTSEIDPVKNPSKFKYQRWWVNPSRVRQGRSALKQHCSCIRDLK